MATGFFDKLRERPTNPLNFVYRFYFIAHAADVETDDKVSIDDPQATGSFGTVEQFWSYYNHLVKPCDLPDLHDCCMFKNGIKPLSEDDANKGGGKWTLRLKKGLASRLWEDLMLAVIGGAYDMDKDLTGISVMIRPEDDLLCVWNDHRDRDATLRIRADLIKILRLPPHAALEYRRHSNFEQEKQNLKYKTSELLAYQTHCKEALEYLWESHALREELRAGGGGSEKGDKGDRGAGGKGGERAGEKKEKDKRKDSDGRDGEGERSTDRGDAGKTEEGERVAADCKAENKEGGVGDARLGVKGGKQGGSVSSQDAN